jgi:hypothetical protein
VRWRTLAWSARGCLVSYQAAWASYDTAPVGTLRLSPHADRIADLRADYRKMALMMFDDPPPAFDEILERIAALEKKINGAQGSIRAAF